MALYHPGYTRRQELIRDAEGTARFYSENAELAIDEGDWDRAHTMMFDASRRLVKILDELLVVPYSCRWCSLNKSEHRNPDYCSGFEPSNNQERNQS